MEKDDARRLSAGQQHERRRQVIRAQVNDGLFWRSPQVLQQVAGLLELSAQDVAVVGLPVKLRAPTISPTTATS